MLPRERVLIDHTFRPDRDAWAGAGYALAEDGAEAPVALAFVPRSKALARALVARAARSALVLVDGARDDGVDALWREVRARRPDAEGIALAHGRLFWFGGGPEAEAAFADWAMPAPTRQGELFTQPGVFSEGGLDRGSALLAAALPARLPPRIGDLGAGVGALAGAVLSREGVVSLDLVEAERLALDCARLNVEDPRARFLWADALALPAGRRVGRDRDEPALPRGPRGHPRAGSVLRGRRRAPPRPRRSALARGQPPPALRGGPLGGVPRGGGRGRRRRLQGRPREPSARGPAPLRSRPITSRAAPGRR
jgi:16S rRNA (guanine1207-N2)-methyltransferase